MIPFNRPAITGNEIEYIRQVIDKGKLSGDGDFTGKCCKWFENIFNARKVLLTTSCTHALEMSALLADIKAGDEVIMSSYTFSSTANAFALRGARIVFTDIRPDTMNINEKLIKDAITPKSKAIVPVHYAGVACEMDAIMDIAKQHDLLVVEDAAQGVMSKYKGRYLGTIGHLGCYSFHETKNYQCGEGGALVINQESFIERAEIIREKGTNRSKFFRGEVDKYSWVDLGSSYLPSELNAATLYAQLESAEKIYNNRLKSWDMYYNGLESLQQKGLLDLPFIPQSCEHNAHIFYGKVENLAERDKLISYLKQEGILSIFHYVPLHSSKAGTRFGRFFGKDEFTTNESERLLRLPMYYSLSEADIEYIVRKIKDFYR